MEKIAEKVDVNKTKIDTSKRYQRITIQQTDGNELTAEFEAYVTKQKDTFWNTWKHYKNGVIDSSRSSFFTYKIDRQKETDSIFKGEIKFFSPADSIPESSIDSRKVTFVYLQKEKDSVYVKEIYTDKNTIEFEYKNYENYSFEGHIMDLRFIKMDSLPDELLLNRNYFTIDTKAWTDNTFVELLKE
ncbi:hypothetical protein [Psychroserpens burtonensis]|uniref:hypothetical protein n=1 Tax=Psychroserpens burtonensis TaxID=49278 RepID=UPI000490C02A|nr:hypothetical protein [Psychroserpens burtonensis]